MFKAYYQKKVTELKEVKANLQAEINNMPESVRRSQKEFKLKQVKVELANFLEAKAK